MDFLEYQMRVNGWGRTSLLPNSYWDSGVDAEVMSHNFEQDETGDDGLSLRDPLKIQKSIQFNLGKDHPIDELKKRTWWENTQPLFESYFEFKYKSKEGNRRAAEEEFFEMGRKNAEAWKHQFNLSDKLQSFKNPQDYFLKYHKVGKEINQRIANLTASLHSTDDSEEQKSIQKQISELREDAREITVGLQMPNSYGSGESLLALSGKMGEYVKNENGFTEFFQQKRNPSFFTSEEFVEFKQLQEDIETGDQGKLGEILQTLSKWNANTDNFDNRLYAASLTMNKEDRKGFNKLRALNFLGSIQGATGFVNNSGLLNLIYYNSTSAQELPSEKEGDPFKYKVQGEGGITGDWTAKYDYSKKIRGLYHSDPELGPIIQQMYINAAEKIAGGQGDDGHKRNLWREMLKNLDPIYVTEKGYDEGTRDILILSPKTAELAGIYGGMPHSSNPNRPFGSTMKQMAGNVLDAVRAEANEGNPLNEVPIVDFIFNTSWIKTDPVDNFWQPKLPGKAAPVHVSRFGHLKDDPNYAYRRIAKTYRALEHMIPADVLNTGWVERASRTVNLRRGVNRQMWIGLGNALGLDPKAGRSFNIDEFKVMNGTDKPNIPISDNRYMFVFGDQAQWDTSGKGIRTIKALKQKNWTHFRRNAEVRYNYRTDEIEYYFKSSVANIAPVIQIYDNATKKEIPMKFHISQFGLEKANLANMADVDYLATLRNFDALPTKEDIEEGGGNLSFEEVWRLFNSNFKNSFWYKTNREKSPTDWTYGPQI